MSDRIPITPLVLTWARERAGLSVDEAAARFAKIGEWERGDSAPTYAQLELLADSLKVPVAIFLFPEPPETPQIEETFRTLPAAEFDILPSKIKLLLRKAKSFQLNLAELNQGRNPSERLIVRDLSPSPEADVRTLALSVRQYMGVSLVEQESWPDADTALKRWRSALHDIGVFVFKDSFRSDEFFGFSLFDQQFPIIYVNNGAPPTRQIFTLFHELSHLMFHTSGLDPRDREFEERISIDQRAIEVLCNAFAAEFLAPAEAFWSAVGSSPPSEQLAEALGRKFHVSREVSYRRFLDAGLIDQATYKDAAEKWKGQRKSAGGGGDYYWTKLTYLGREYVSLALSQYRQSRIDEGQLAQYLDIKERNLPSLGEYFERAPA